MAIAVGARLTETYTASTLATSGNGFAVGDHYFGHDGKVYKFVQYTTGAGPVAAVTGNVCYYFEDETLKVTSDLSDSVNIGAGVLQAAPGNNEFCWIQIKGLATIAPALTAGADGNSLTAAGATDGTLDVSAAATDAVVAYAVDASAKLILCDFPF
jgi:hypothetical protein